MGTVAKKRRLRGKQAHPAAPGAPGVYVLNRNALLGASKSFHNGVSVEVDHAASVFMKVWTVTSGRKRWTDQVTTGMTKKRQESAPHSPCQPLCGPAVVSCWQGEPATTKSKQAMGKGS